MTPQDKISALDRVVNSESFNIPHLDVGQSTRVEPEQLVVRSGIEHLGEHLDVGGIEEPEVADLPLERQARGHEELWSWDGKGSMRGVGARRPAASVDVAGEAQGFRPPKPPLGRAWIGAPVSFSVRFEVNHDVGVNDSSGSGTDFSTSWSETGQNRAIALPPKRTFVRPEQTINRRLWWSGSLGIVVQQRGER